MSFKIGICGNAIESVHRAQANGQRGKLLLQVGHEAWGMFDHVKQYSWVLSLLIYDSQ